MCSVEELADGVAAARQTLDPGLDGDQFLGELFGHCSRARRFVAGTRVLGLEQHLHEPCGQPGLDQAGDPRDALDVRVVVGAVPVLRTRRRQQTLLLVVPDHARGHTGPTRNIADLQ